MLLDDLQTKVEANATVSGSAMLLLQGLKAKLDAAGTDSTKLKELSQALGSQTQALADAVVSNTPAEDAPPPGDTGGSPVGRGR